MCWWLRILAIQKAGTSTLINALAGKASGFRIQSPNGEAGSGSNIIVRGVNTFIGNSQPLIILDGAPISNETSSGTNVAQTSRLNDLNTNDIASLHDPLVPEDFSAGGLLNPQGQLTAERALLREIIEERYISGFCTFIPFDDARRLRGAKENDIAVAIPLNTATATQQPERLLYPQEELISNPNVPTDPGLYTPTQVNR